MRKITLILFTIFITSITSFAQNSSSIVGNWKLVSIDTGVEIPEEYKAATQEAFEVIIDNTSMLLNSDGTAVGNSINPTTGEKVVEKSTYTFDGTTLSTTDSDGNIDTIKLDNFDGKKMIIHETESGMNLTMIFEKQ